MVLNFHKEDGVDRKWGHADVKQDTDEEEMEDVIIDNKRERHWRIVFEDNGVGVGNRKAILHNKRWDVYMN